MLCMFLWYYFLVIRIYGAAAVKQAIKSELQGAAVTVNQLGGDVEKHRLSLLVLCTQRTSRHIEVALIRQSEGVGGDRVYLAASHI